MISALRQKSKFEFQTFLKKNRISGFPWCSTREDLSIDVSITNVGDSRTDIDETKVISALRQKSKFEFQTFLKKNRISGFPWCSTREDLSIDVSITNVGDSRTDIDETKVISALRQKSNFELF